MPEEIDHIANLQKRLYSRDPENLPKRKFGILHPIKEKTTSTWGQTKLPEEKILHKKSASVHKKFFIFALVFFSLALGAALFSMYRGAMTLSSKNVDLIILGNSFVGGGEELPIQVEIINKNSADLVNAVLVVNYPKGATDETGTDIVRLERAMGTIYSGKTKSEEFVAILYGEQGISREIKTTFTYQLEGSSAVFQKESTFSVMVNSSPVGLAVNAPTAVVSNQPFTLAIRNTFAGDKLLNNVVTRVEYPNGFIFQSANPAPTLGNNIWNIGDLKKGDERVINIMGKLVGEESDEKAFRVYVGTPENETSSRIAVVYNSLLKTLIISKPFISGSISISGQTDDIVALEIGDRVDGQVSWVNNSNSVVTSPIFTLSLGGENIDPSSILAPNSFYNELENKIIWNAESNSNIQSIAPGAKGVLPFSFATKENNSGLRDITLGLSIKGSFSELNLEQTIDTIDQKIVRFASNLQFAAQSLFSIGAIENTGPYPVKADVDTTFGLTWTILPTENPLTDILVSATLPVGVNWTGVVVPQTENISYNQDSRMVTWKISSMPKATSIPRSKSVSFQIVVKPTRSQVGAPLDLLGPTSIVANDTVTSTKISGSRGALTTKLDTDPAYTQGNDRVLP